MIRMTVTVLFSLILAAPVWAGAWLRDEGTGFLSFGSTVFELDDTGQQLSEQSFFVEYGLRPKLTLGASGSMIDGLGGEGQVFLRIPIQNGERKANMSAEFGLGANSNGIDVDPYLRTGVSWGRGIAVRDKGGWVNIDSSALWGLSGSDTRFKIDSTVGLSITDRTQFMAQSFIDIGPGEDSHTLIPSLIFADKAGKTRYVVGYEHRTGARASKGLKFGFWRDF